MSATRVIDERLEREKQAGKFLYKIDEFLDTELTLVNNVTATISVWVSACIVILSSALYIAAFATTGWGIAVTQNGMEWEYGLWKYCVSGSDGCSSITDLSASYICCQVFAVLSLVSLFTSVITLILYCIYDHMKAVKVIRYGVFFTRLASAIFLLITFAVYAGTWYKGRYNPPQDTVSLSYSFALTATTFTLECIATILMGLEMRNQALEIEMKEQDRRELAAGNVNRGYDQVNGNPDDIPNMTTPYELFQQFSQVEQNNVPPMENNIGYTDINAVNQYPSTQDHNRYTDVRPKTMNSAKPYSNNEKNNIGYTDINAVNQYPSTHDHSRNNDVRPKSMNSVKPYSNNEHNDRYRDVKSKTGNFENQYHNNNGYHSEYANTDDEPIYNEINIDNIHATMPPYNASGNTISVHADVHTNAPKQPVRPARKSKKYSSQDNGGHERSIHSYENIPDGQTGSTTNVRGHNQDTSNRKPHNYSNNQDRHINQNPLPDSQGSKSNGRSRHVSDNPGYYNYAKAKQTSHTEKPVPKTDGYYNTNQETTLRVSDKHKAYNDTSNEGNHRSKPRSDLHGYYNYGPNVPERLPVNKPVQTGTVESNQPQRY